eukprot:5541320-Pyramimonas_sp.AAC.1
MQGQKVLAALFFRKRHEDQIHHGFVPFVRPCRAPTGRPRPVSLRIPKRRSARTEPVPVGDHATDAPFRTPARIHRWLREIVQTGPVTPGLSLLHVLKGRVPIALWASSHLPEVQKASPTNGF